MISDIDECVKSSTCRVFADDTKMSKEISSKADGDDLQPDLNSVYTWGEKNEMKFNNTKFQCIRYGNNDLLTQLLYTAPDGSEIPPEEHVKDLGVIMSRDLTFTEHIQTRVTKCRSLMGWIFRTFITRDAAPMMIIYKALVLPRIDYCSQLYFSSSQLEMALESIQRHFTSRLSEVQDQDYWNRLSSLGLYSIQRRNERYMIIYVWKILEGLAPNLSNNTIKPVYSDRRGRQCSIPHLPRSNCPQRVKTVRDQSFGIKGPQLFNVIPKVIRNLSDVTIDQFKRQLDKFLRSVPDEPSVPGYVARRAVPSNSLRDLVPYQSRTMYGSCTQRP